MTGAGFWDNVGAGVVGGLLASFILWLATVIWRNRFRPWWADTVYRGIRIDGNWKLQPPEGNDADSDDVISQDETLEVEQVADRLSGKLILVPGRDEQLVTRTLEVQGTISDRFVMISFFPPKPRRNLGYAMFLGEICGDGARLVGRAVYYDIQNNVIRAMPAVYVRQATS